jgi:hypothetical protein
MTERISSPDNDPDPRDGAATEGNGKPEGQHSPASLRPGDSHALKSPIARPADNDQADESNKPSMPERFTTAAKNIVVPTVAAVIIGATSYVPLPHPYHDPAEGGRDRSELTAKADRATAAGKNADIWQGSAGQDIRPSAGDRHVAEASAPVLAAENDASPGEGLEKWVDEYGKESMSAVAEDLEKRKEES